MFDLYVYFLAIVFVLWLVNKSKPGTHTTVTSDTTVTTNEQSNSEKVKQLNNVLKNSNPSSARPIAPFCYLWVKSIKSIYPDNLLHP